MHRLKYGVRLLLLEQGTESTGYEEYRAGEVRILVQGTADFPNTKYGKYGVRIAPCWRGYELRHGVQIFIKPMKYKK